MRRKYNEDIDSYAGRYVKRKLLAESNPCDGSSIGSIVLKIEWKE